MIQTKIIEYGTHHKVKVLSATETLIAVVGDDGEGYLLMKHGMKDLPNEGDEGTITFTKRITEEIHDMRLRPNNGYWHYQGNDQKKVVT